MNRTRWSAFILVVLVAVLAAGQAKIVIPAGSPEDKALQAISNENDAQKRIAMLEEFVKTYAANRDALAFGQWQLSQAYQAAGDLAKALAYGDKALEVMPDNLDILVWQVNVAQQLKDNAKLMDYCARGGAVLIALDKQPKPAGMSDDEFAARRSAEKTAAQASADSLEAAAYNAISAEQDPKLRLQFVERFTQAFPQSRFLEPVMTQAIVSLQQMNDTARMAEFGDKVLAANPNSLPVLTLLASAFADDPKGAYLPKAKTYAQKAIELSKDDPQKATYAGFAHRVLGSILMKEEKTPAAVVELKTAVDMLKDSPQDLAVALYYLGFAHAKMKQYAEARTVLTQALAIEGPVQPLAKDLLEKVNAAKK